MQPTQIEKMIMPRIKYANGTSMILLVSANQSAAVSMIAIETLRLLKLQARKIYQATARIHVTIAVQKRY